MTITVKVFGTLGNHCPGYDHSAGMKIPLKDNMTVRGLIEYLALPVRQVGIVTINGKLAKADQPIPFGADVKIFQPLAGG